MSRIPPLDPEKTQGKVREILAGIKAKSGRLANLFTNFINHVADTAIDFPQVPPLAPPPAA